MMTAAELSQYVVEHGNRITAVETENEHCKAQHAQTGETLKEISGLLGRIAWGTVGILATALGHLLVALISAAKH